MSKQRFVITGRLDAIIDVIVTDDYSLTKARTMSYMGDLHSLSELLSKVDYHLRSIAITRWGKSAEQEPYTGAFEGLTISSGVSTMAEEVEV